MNPTLRTIARAASVCPMTVSLALRNHPSIPPATRERIQGVAESQGYRPDPTVAKLMGHLARRRPLRHRANLCALMPAATFVRPQGYHDRLQRGLRARAESLGFAFTLVEVTPGEPPARLRRLLRSRGVEGIVLTPMSEPTDLSAALPWDEFSVVSVTPSVTRPAFHMVSPNHYDNMTRVCLALKAAGHRRIGLALPEDRDLRVRHRWTGAVTWHNHFGGCEPVPPLIDPSSPTAMDPDRLSRWIREHQPDVVITDYVERLVVDCARAVAAPRRRRARVVAMSWPNPHADAGIDQQVEEIAALAIDRLAGLIQHGERGIPATPSTAMVDGIWKTRANYQRNRAEPRPI